MDDNKQFEALSCLRSAVLSPPPAKGMRRTLKQEVSGGKSLSPRGGKHYGQLYRHGLLWHVQKWPNKFADWQRRDGRLRGRRALQHSNKCLLDLLYRHSGGRGTRDCESVKRTETQGCWSDSFSITFFFLNYYRNTVSFISYQKLNMLPIIMLLVRNYMKI